MSKTLSESYNGTIVGTDGATFNPSTLEGHSGFGVYTLDLRGQLLELDVDGALEDYRRKLVADHVIPADHEFLFTMGYGAGFQHALEMLMSHSTAQPANGE